MNRALLIVVSIGWLLALGTAQARSVNPKHRDPVQPAIEYRLEQDVAVQGYNILYTLRAGRYVLSYKDRRGRSKLMPVTDSNVE